MEPIGVLLPSRNSMTLLPRHFETMKPWLDDVEEIVVVDSDSDDGTVEFLHRALRGRNVRFLHHSPGLYQSWNHGIEHVTSPYCYISTIGDSITREGLLH